MSRNQISKAECKKLQRIRTRASYLLFQQLYDFLNNKPSVADILRKFYDVLDARKNFGSRQNAEYAAESLSLVLKNNSEMNKDIHEYKFEV
jgi:transcription termination factor NusB